MSEPNLLTEQSNRILTITFRREYLTKAATTGSLADLKSALAQRSQRCG